MANFIVEAKNGAEIEKKPRVYFTCHPNDFDKHFKKLCDDIFKTHDCAIYYTPDMTDVIDEEEMGVDLGRSNLFVVPVTFRLLSTPNRAMDVDIQYALREHIPILPIMMESGIDELYSRADKFGELQYLNPNSADPTEISYEEKLKKYLESVLISDEMAKRVRGAFDAYIFLSYRKKDRKYANELMHLIHSNPECRDIAIWFDEFLIPGESFKESIDKMLRDSKLFTLLVTPNLLEEPDGKPNFVMGEEYPAAQRSGIKIVPAEMVKTDKRSLAEKFENIPACISPYDGEFYGHFLDAVTKTATTANNTPEHNFLIGLAYLDGIDMEVNREYAIELITSAAEAGLVEAIDKLYSIYDEGIGVGVDYRKAVIWAEKKYEILCDSMGEEHPDTCTSLNDLSVTYINLGDYHKALELAEKAYSLHCKILGDEHPDTLSSFNNLAEAYEKIGNHHKALEFKKKAYALNCKILGEEHPVTLTTLNNLAVTYAVLGDYGKALELTEKEYEMSRKILGEKHPDVLISMANLAVAYGDLGDHHKELELSEKAYALLCEVSGEEHPDTLTSLNNLAATYEKIGNHHKALELMEKVCVLRCKILGKDHPDTLNSLTSLVNLLKV